MDLDAEMTRIRNRLAALEGKAGTPSAPSPAGGQPLINSLSARLTVVERTLGTFKALEARLSALEKGPGASKPPGVG